MAKASTVTLNTATPMVMGDPVSYTIVSENSAYRHKVGLQSWNGAGLIREGIAAGTYQNTTFLENPEVPFDRTSANYKLTVYTYNSATNEAAAVGASTGTGYIGKTELVFTVTIPPGATPTLTNLGLSEGNSVVTAASVGAFVGGLTKLSWSLTYITPYASVKSATVEYEGNVFAITPEYNMALNNGTYLLRGTATVPIKSSGSVPVTATIRDGLGRTVTRTENIVVLSWYPPKTVSFTVNRSTASGVADPDGNYASFRYEGDAASVYNGTQKNGTKYEVHMKLHSSASWGAPVIPAASSWSTDLGPIITGTIPNVSGSSSYDIRITFYDKFSTTVAISTVAKSQVTLHMGDGVVGIGKKNARGTLDVGGIGYVQGLNAGTGIAVTDFNLATETGWYWSSNGANQPPTGDSWWSVAVQTFGDSNGTPVRIIQTAKRPNKPGGTIYERTWFSGTWTEWFPVYAGDDSGWVNIAVNSPFLRQGSVNPQVRKIGNQVFPTWGWSSTNIGANSGYVVGVLPVGYRPYRDIYFRWGTGSASMVAMGVAFPNGNVEIRTPAAGNGFVLPNYYIFPGITWLAD